VSFKEKKNNTLDLDELSIEDKLDTLKDYYSICLFTDGWTAEYIKLLPKLLMISSSTDNNNEESKIEFGPEYIPPAPERRQDSLRARLLEIEKIAAGFGFKFVRGAPTDSKILEKMHAKLTDKKKKKKKGQESEDDVNVAFTMMDSDSE
jgi:hypothetical protein